MDLSLRRLSLAISCLLIPVSGFSDEVFLKNGDHLTGTVKTTKDGKLILETSYSGEIGIRIADIQRVTTDKPVSVTLDDETKMTGILTSPDGAEMRIAADVDQQPLSISMAQISGYHYPGDSRAENQGSVEYRTGYDPRQYRPGYLSCRCRIDLPLAR